VGSKGKFVRDNSASGYPTFFFRHQAWGKVWEKSFKLNNQRYYSVVLKRQVVKWVVLHFNIEIVKHKKIIINMKKV
jgi:hypothetical protein